MKQAMAQYAYLGAGIEHGLVVDARARCHHHATTDGIERVGSKTSTDGDTPTESEGSQERTLKSTDQDNRF